MYADVSAERVRKLAEDLERFDQALRAAPVKQGLERSLALAPQDRDLRMRVARLRLADGDADAARALLAPLAYDPHGGAMSEQAAEMIATIDSKRAEDAAGDAAAGDPTHVGDAATSAE